MDAYTLTRVSRTIPDEPYKVGDKFPVWYNPEGIILKITPYAGKFPESFNQILRVSSKPNRARSRGWGEIAVMGKLL